MTSRRDIGLGTSLAISYNSSSVTIGGITDVSGPDSDGDTIDSTALDSTTGNFRSFIGGMIDGGELTFTTFYDSTDSARRVLNRAYSDRSSNTFTLTLGGSSAAETFSGIVNGLGREITLDGITTGDVTIKVDGDPGFNATT